MWATAINHRCEELERRIRGLEARLLELEMGLYIPYRMFEHYSYTPTKRCTYSYAIQLILNHLKLELDQVPGTDPMTILKPVVSKDQS